MSETRDPLEVVQELHAFLQGRLPASVSMTKPPKLSAKKAFEVIWFLQEVSGLVSSNFELCGYCGYIYDSDSEGHSSEENGQFCGSCEHHCPREEEPEPGEIWEYRKSQRRVTYYPDPLRPGEVRWTNGVRDFHSPIKTWQKWARKAELIHAAE